MDDFNCVIAEMEAVSHGRNADVSARSDGFVS
jgi:hypothetical protein